MEPQISPQPLPQTMTPAEAHDLYGALPNWSLVPAIERKALMGTLTPDGLRLRPTRAIRFARLALAQAHWLRDQGCCRSACDVLRLAVDALEDASLVAAVPTSQRYWPNTAKLMVRYGLSALLFEVGETDAATALRDAALSCEPQRVLRLTKRRGRTIARIHVAPTSATQP